MLLSGVHKKIFYPKESNINPKCLNTFTFSDLYRSFPLQIGSKNLIK